MDQITESTVRQFQAGDTGAFEAIFKAESTRLGRFIRRYVRSDETAEDLFQEVWIRTWDKRGQLQEPARFTSWMYQIARNLIFEQSRKAKRKLQITVFGDLMDPEETWNRWDNTADSAPSPRQSAARAELAAKVEAHMEVLDDQAREMIALRYGAGLALREVAEVLDAPLGTVCAKISRSLRTLRGRLEDEGIQWEP